MITPNAIIDLTTLTFLIILLLFSIFSISFIFHFRLKTLRHPSHHLRDFNSLWPARILLVFFALLWSLTELLRLSPPSHLLPLHRQRHVCKVYLVASQGLFQPSFFVTLLFLVSATLSGSSKANYHNTLLRALSVVFFSVLPILLLQVFFTFFAHRVPLFSSFPDAFRRDALVLRRGVFCAYPLFSTVVLGGFGAGYVAYFVFVCWQAVSLVINKTLRVRIFGLAVSVALAVPAQSLCLALSVLSVPGDALFELLSLMGFLCVLSCAVVGEGILVIRPMTDALVVEGSVTISAASSPSSTTSSPAASSFVHEGNKRRALC